jgi:hypothetical protein
MSSMEKCYEVKGRVFYSIHPMSLWPASVSSADFRHVFLFLLMLVEVFGRTCRSS